jgi:uncharacterized protein YcgI (DUF1989 family)
MVSLGKLVQQRLIPGAYGGAVGIKEGQYLKVIDVQGKQVCDFFAFNPEDPRQFLSGSHTRVSLLQTQAKFKTIVVGRPLLDNSRQPMLLVEEDTVGVHDWLMAPCDEARYSLDFGIANHRNCKTNSLEALEEFNLVPPVFPDPLNLFMNTSFDKDMQLIIQPPVSKAGDHVILRALRNLIVVGSACPMDQNPTNDFNTTDIMFEVYEPPSDE